MYVVSAEQLDSKRLCGAPRRASHAISGARTFILHYQHGKTADTFL